MPQTSASIVLACVLSGLALTVVAQPGGPKVDPDAPLKAPSPIMPSMVDSDGRIPCTFNGTDYPVTGRTGLADGFVSVSNGEFRLGGKPFYFAGFNYWPGLAFVANASEPFRYANQAAQCGEVHVINVMNEAARNNLNVLRLWGYTRTTAIQLEESPGEFNERVFKAMDFMNNEASKRGLKLIWVFTDNWWEGGIDKYVEFSGTASSHQDFYTDERAQQIYQNHIEKILNRVNSINGKVNKDDPTIMAWNLANEPRSNDSPSSEMQQWIEQTSCFIKQIDSNHLVGIGEEGFYGPESPASEEVLGEWSKSTGQAYLSNVAADCVDYASVHVWVAQWNLQSVEQRNEYIQSRIDSANEYVNGVPVVLEEFGLKLGIGVREKYYRDAFALAEENARKGRLAGTLFWTFFDLGVPVRNYGVNRESEVYPTITEHANTMAKIG